MFRVYILIVVLGLLGGAAYAAKYYYDTTQATIAQLRENNAKLEVANEENQQMKKTAQVNNDKNKEVKNNANEAKNKLEEDNNGTKN